jgi:hypothetical protein
MELLYAMIIVHTLSTCGGAILLDGGQGLTLVHFSAQRKHILWDTSGA